MNNRTDHQKRMAEALRLTRAGRLLEATGVIQRSLGGQFHGSEANASHGGTAGPTEAVEAEYRVLDEKPSSRDASIQSTDTANDKPAMGERLRRLFFDGSKIHESRLTTGKKRKGRPEPSSSSVQPTGRFIDGSFTNEAGTRTYKLYIPTTYVGGQPLPLLVMLHGCTQSPADFAAGTRMNVLAEKERFLVVYPEQAERANVSKCWNWFETTDQFRGSGEPSLIAGITQKIMSMYSVNAERVYLVGMSAGGAMATIMAATYPELYAAVGVHSGLPYGAAHDLPSGFKAMQQGSRRSNLKLRKIIPLILFHGDHDRTVAKVNADHTRDQWLHALESEGKHVVGPTVERGVVRGNAYTRFIYQNTDGRILLEEWIIHRAGHAWSGGSSSGSFTNTKGPDASAEIVSFLRKHSGGN